MWASASVEAAVQDAIKTVSWDLDGAEKQLPLGPKMLSAFGLQMAGQANPIANSLRA